MKKFFYWLCGVSSDSKGAGLGRGTNRGSNLAWWQTLAKLKPAVMVVLTIGGGEAMAANRADDGGGYTEAMTRDTPGGVYSLGPQSWCCGKIPAGAGPRSAPSAFYSAVKSAFGSMYNAITALNNKLNRTSNFDPTYGATNYNSNLGSMDPNSRGSGVTAW